MPGMTTSDSSDDAEKCKDAQRLGPMGLALHYANIIVQIDSIVCFSYFFLLGVLLLLGYG